MNTKSVFKLLFLCSIISILGFSIAHSALATEPINVGLENPLGTTTTITQLINRITGWVLGIAGSIMMIVLIFAGFRYLTAGANEDRAKNAKKMLTWAIIGIAIIVGAAAITNAVMDALGVPETTTGGGGGTANVAAALDTVELAANGDLNGNGEIDAGDTINIVANLTNDTDQDITLNDVRLIAVVGDSSATGINNLEQGDKKKVAGVSTLIADTEEILNCEEYGSNREYLIIREYGSIIIKARETVGLHSEWTVLDISPDIMIDYKNAGSEQEACAILGTVPIGGGGGGTEGLLAYESHTVKRSSKEDENGEPKVVPGAEVEMEVCLKNTGGKKVDEANVNLSPQEEGVSTTNNPRRYAGVDPEEVTCKDYDFSIAADYKPTSINFKVQGATSDDKVSESNIKMDLGTGGGGGGGECSSSGCVTFQEYVIQDSSIGGSRPNAKVVPGATVMMDVCLENKTSTDFGDTVQATLTTSDSGITVTNNPGKYSGMHIGKHDCYRYTFSIPGNYTKSSIDFTIQGSKVTSANFNVALDTSFKPNLTAGSFGSGIGNTLVVKGTKLNPTFSINNSGAMALAANQNFNVEFYACYGADAAACAGLTSKPEYKFFSGGARENAAWWTQDGSIPAGGGVMVKYSNFEVKESGNLYFGIKLDTGNSINESNESDNTGGPYEVQIASWNAEVKELTLTDDPTQGTRITYIDPPTNTKIVYRGSFKITNTGTGSTDLGSTDFYYKIDLIDGPCLESTTGLYNSQEQPLMGYLLPGYSVVQKLDIDTRDNYPFSWQAGKSYRVRFVLRDHSTLNRIPKKVVCAAPFTYGVAVAPTYNATVSSASLALSGANRLQVSGVVRNNSTEKADISYGWNVDKSNGSATDSSGCLKNASKYDSGEAMNAGSMPAGAEVTISKKIDKPTEEGYYQAVVTANVPGDTNTTDNKKCSTPLKIENGGTEPPSSAISYDLEASRAELSYNSATSTFTTKVCVKNNSTQNGQPYSGFEGYYEWDLKKDGTSVKNNKAGNFTIGSDEEKCFTQSIPDQTAPGLYQLYFSVSVDKNTDNVPGNNSKSSNTVTVGTPPPPAISYDLEASRAELSYDSAANRFIIKVCFKNHSTQNGQPYSGFTGYYEWSLKRNGTEPTEALATSFAVDSSEKCFEHYSYKTGPGEYQFSSITSPGSGKTDVNSDNNSKSSNKVTVTTTPEPPQPTPADYKTEISTCMIGDDPDHPGAYWYRVVYENRSTRDGQPIRANVSWGIKMQRNSSWSGDCPESGGSSEFSYDNTLDCQANGVCVDLGARNYKPSQKGYYHIEAWAGVSGSSSGKSYKCTSRVYYVPAISASLDLSSANAFVPPLLDEQIKNFWKKLQEVIE